MQIMPIVGKGWDPRLSGLANIYVRMARRAINQRPYRAIAYLVAWPLRGDSARIANRRL